MLKDVIHVRPLGGPRLQLRVEDGADGAVGTAAVVPFRGVFAALRDPDVFVPVRVDPDIEPTARQRCGCGAVAAGGLPSHSRSSNQY